MSYEEGFSKVLALPELRSNKLREVETVTDQVQKKVESMHTASIEVNGYLVVLMRLPTGIVSEEQL